MPRPRSHSVKELKLNAMKHFWKFGFHASSMSDLVDATNVSRHGIYSEFGGKHQLFLACLELYEEEVVTPAFARVESADAGLAEIADYFEFQINRAEQSGLPGPGCLVANTLTELAPHDPDIQKAARAHNRRLKKGFSNAISNVSRGSLSKAEVGELGSFLVISAQGLWSLSRAFATPSYCVVKHRPLSNWLLSGWNHEFERRSIRKVVWTILLDRISDSCILDKRVRDISILRIRLTYDAWGICRYP